jgi:oligopeptide transport system substrate-binding protein
LALFEGLVEYDPQTLEPIPAIAERWETNAESTEFTFYLRRDARWSDGESITAHDFVYTMRRGLDSQLASRAAGQGYYIKYAKAFNEGAVFVQDTVSGEFLANDNTIVPTLLTLPGDEKEKNKLFAANPQLQEVIEGKNLVPVKAEDIGVKAIDSYTLRISLTQSVPFFIKVLSHNFFRVVPEKAISKFGKNWTKPENIVTSGAFRLKEWSPYDEIIVEKNPHYWDAATVALEEIQFYPVEEQATVMNLYKAGYVDATYNRSVPRSWLSMMQKKRDHQDASEASIDYLIINTTQPPMNDVRVRRAFDLAINKRIFSAARPNTKPLSSLIPPNVFYEYSPAAVPEFNPELARKLLAEAGFADTDGNYDASKFPINEVALTFNTSDGNRLMAELIQSHWKQNLNLTVPLKNMETKTFVSVTSKLEYKGFARFGYAADYIDSYSLLSIFAAPSGDNGTGWYNKSCAELLDKGNQTFDARKRSQLLAEAESLLLSEQPIIPLTTSSTNWLKKPYVKGMYPNAVTLLPWKFVYIERDEDKW